MDLSPRLATLVNNALKYPIAEIVAPAGFGKSTIVDAIASANAFRVARIRVDLNDPAFALMTALCNAVRVHAPDLAAALPDAYANVRDSKRHSELVSWFLAPLAAVDTRIAIDDLHLLREDDTAWGLLGSLIEASSLGQARWVLTSRMRPPLPTVEWVARGCQAKPITEKELAFDANDVLCAARSIGMTLSSTVAQQLCELTKGWPLISLYALRLVLQGDDLSLLDEALKWSGMEIITERLVSQLASADVSLVMAIALYDGASAPTLELTHNAVAQNLNRLIATGIPLMQESDGRWRLHDLVREYLLRRESNLRACEAARIVEELQRRGRIDDALRIAAAGGSDDTVESVLKGNVRHFVSAGDRHELHDFMARRGGALKSSWQLAVIRGTDELRRGRFAIAESYIRSALDLTGGRNRLYVLAQLAYVLLWRGGETAGITILKQCAAAELPDDADMACEILSILAWGFSLIGCSAEADQAASRAVSLLPKVSDPIVQARVYTRAGMAAASLAQFEKADELAQQAIEIGEQCRLFDTLSRAFNLRRLVLAPNREVDSATCAKKAAYYAAKMLDRVTVHCSEADLLNFACRRGDIVEAKALLSRLLPIPEALKSKNEAVVYACSAHVAMLGHDYRKAAELLACVTSFGDTVVEVALAPLREMVFLQYLALLAQLQGHADEAVTHARRIFELSSHIQLRGMERAGIPELEISKIICAAILGIHGHMADTEAILDGMRNDAHELYRRDLAKWVSEALIDSRAEPSEEAKTRANGFIILLRRTLEATQPIALTPAERRVLESLALGRASKEIAAITGRSVKTVHNQVASIMRKLSARSRGEAVARARRSGLLTAPDREASPV
jgi:ATP/maltotriose-dependent transcriptional regulator MalT